MKRLAAVCAIALCVLCLVPEVCRGMIYPPPADSGRLAVTELNTAILLYDRQHSETRVCRDMNALGVHAGLACRAFLAKCRQQGLDVFITETYRSRERHKWLYAMGRTAPGPIVTTSMVSCHTGRFAWDISFHSTGYSDKSKYERAGQIAEELGIAWGGNWAFRDLPHFEYIHKEAEKQALVACLMFDFLTK